MVNIAQMLNARITSWHAEHFVVATGLIGHPEHPDRAAPDLHTGEGRLAEQYESVQRVTVQAKGVLDKAVVVRVPGRGKEHAV